MKNEKFNYDDLTFEVNFKSSTVENIKFPKFLFYNIINYDDLIFEVNFNDIKLTSK